MLEIRLLAEPGSSPEISLRAPSLCVSGGSVRLGTNLSADITYSHEMWAYRGRTYRMLAVTGSLYLVFGIAREPTIVSHPIDHFHFVGPTMSTDGVGIAKYSEHQNTWHGLLRPMWWVSMRIVTSDFLDAGSRAKFGGYAEPQGNRSGSQSRRLASVKCSGPIAEGPTSS